MKLDGDTAIKTVNLLVVDDEEPCLMSVMMMFYETDVNVIAERDSRKALEYIKENRDIDVILLDLMMPDLDGVEFLEGLQAIGLEKDIPVILQTGSTNFEFVERALSRGAIGYIPKPFMKDEAIEAINRVLGR